MPATTRDPRATLIHRIPDDILREIFLHCLSASNGAVTPSVTNGPLQISQVCSNWRAVCHEYGRMWRSLALRKEHLELSMADETWRWLERSNKAPIHFELVLTSDTPTRIRQLRTCTGQVSGYNRDLLLRHTNAASLSPKIKRSHQDKLEALLLHAPLPPPQNVLFKMLKPSGSSITRLVLGNVPIANLVRLPRRTFPNLERLILVIMDRLDCWQFDWITHGLVKAFLDCPHLRYVALGRYFREDTSDFIQLPLHQLTHFIDSGPFFNTRTHICTIVAQLSSAAIHLRFLHISFDEDTPVVFPSALADAGFTWRSIEGLSIDSTECDELGSDFFRVFKFPNLRTLRFAGPVPELNVFLSSGGGVQLKHASFLDRWESPPPDFFPSLSKHMPQLQSLEVAQQALEPLLEGINAAPPSLHTLSIRCGSLSIYGGRFNDEFLRDETSRFFYKDVRQPHRQHFRTIKIFDEAPRMPSFLAEHLFKSFRACSASAGVGVEITLERVRRAHEVLDPLFLDPELERWEGLRELCAEGRDKTFLYSDS